MSNPDPHAARTASKVLSDLHTARTESLNRLYYVASVIARIHQAFMDKYRPSFDAVTAMMLHRQGRALVIPRLINDLHTFIGPWFDLYPPDAEAARYPWLPPITVSVFQRHPPSTRALSRMIRLAAAIAPSPPRLNRRIPSTPTVLGTHRSSSLDVVDAAIDEMRHVRALSSRVQSLAPRVPVPVLPSIALHVDFPTEVVTAIQAGGAIHRRLFEVPVPPMELDTLAPLLERQITLTHWPPVLARVHRPSAAREVLTTFGHVLAPASRVSEALRLVNWLPTGAVIHGTRFFQPIPREVLETYASRIHSPLSEVQSAYYAASRLPLTVVREAAPPLLPEIATREPEAVLSSPRGFIGDSTVGPAPEIRQAAAYVMTLRAVGHRFLNSLVAGLEVPGYELARHVAGLPAVAPLSLANRFISMPIAQTYLDVLRAIGGPHLLDAVDAATFPQHLTRAVLTASRVQARTPISRVSEALRIVRQLPAGGVTDEVPFTQLAPSHPLHLAASGVTAWGPGFRMPPLVRGLPPRMRSEAPSVDHEIPYPEPPPASVFVDQTKIPRDDEWDAWMSSMREASAVARRYHQRMSSLISGEIMARGLTVIQPFIQEAVATTHGISRSAVMQRPWLATPITPVLMELGFGISEAKQLYPAVEAMSWVRRAFDRSRLLPRATRVYPVGVEEAMERFISLLYAPAERYTLERIPLEAPRAVPTVKLPELMSHLASMRAPTQPERPPRRDRKAFERPRSIEVKVEAPKDEQDLRALRRQITRILREEARRHGVY